MNISLTAQIFTYSSPRIENTFPLHFNLNPSLSSHLRLSPDCVSAVCCDWQEEVLPLGECLPDCWVWLTGFPEGEIAKRSIWFHASLSVLKEQKELMDMEEFVFFIHLWENPKSKKGVKIILMANDVNRSHLKPWVYRQMWRLIYGMCSQAPPPLPQ